MINGIISVIAIITLNLGVGTGNIEKYALEANLDGLTPNQEAVSELIKYYLPPVGPIDMDKEFWEDIDSDRCV